jgi:hypothetical protein
MRKSAVAGLVDISETVKTRPENDGFDVFNRKSYMSAANKKFGTTRQTHH